VNRGRCSDNVAWIGFTTTYKTCGDCQTTRKSYKTSYSVGWVVGWKKVVFLNNNGWPLLLAAIALTEPIHIPKLTAMEVHIKPETASRLTELASKSGRATDDLVEDALAGYLTEVAEVGEMLDGRYDGIKSGRVKTIDGEAFFDGLRQREDELLKQRNPK
jgi:predicted transcriptional regulator